MTLHAKIHVACKQLGIEEDDRRDLYERITGKRSLTQMTPAQHQRVVRELERLGFEPSSNASRKRLEGQYAPKLQALWIACWNLGLTRSKTDASLLAFVKRQTGVDHTRFLRHKEDADKVIEALKGWMAREGGVDWSLGEYMHKYQRVNGYKIAFAQWVKIGKGSGYQDFIKLVRQHPSERDLSKFTEADWIPVMNALGREIRAVRDP